MKKSSRWIKHIISALIIILGVTFLTFLLAYLSPEDAAVVKLSKMGTGYTQEVLESTRREMGLDRPFIVQYGRWMKNILHLDFGTSYRTNTSVGSMLASAFPTTLALTGLSLAITLSLAFPIGIYCADHPNGVLDRITMGLSYLFTSLPMFFISLGVLYVVCIKWGLMNVRAAPGLPGLIMPALVMGVTLASWYIRQIRTVAIEQLNSDYVKALYCRGVKRSSILGRHVFKNCLLPTITLIGVSFGSMLGGSAIVESIFSVNGVGSLAVTAVTARDYPFIQAYAALMAALYLAVNFAVDILYKKLDPRVSV